jgi:hypothetical protein
MDNCTNTSHPYNQDAFVCLDYHGLPYQVEIYCTGCKRRVDTVFTRSAEYIEKHYFKPFYKSTQYEI